MRVLPYHQAHRCEHARSGRCRCQCGGAYHGAARMPVERLPLDDPHSVKQRCYRCGGTGRVQFGGDGPHDLCYVCEGRGWFYNRSAERALRAREKHAPQDSDRVGVKSPAKADTEEVAP